METAYKIEKGVPVPENTGKGRGVKKTKYPLRQMEVGDSFFVPISPECDFKKKRNSIVASCWRRVRVMRLEIQLSYRVESDKSGIRIWRIK